MESALASGIARGIGQGWFEDVEKYDLLLAHALIAPLQALRIDTLVFDQVVVRSARSRGRRRGVPGSSSVNPNKSSVSGGGSQLDSIILETRLLSLE